MSAVMEDGFTLQLPRRKRGRPSAAADAAFQQLRQVFADKLIQIRGDLKGKKQAVRSWCYDLEPYGLNKNDFDYAEGFINDLRTDGLLPIDFTKEDQSRVATGGEDYIDDTTPEEEAVWIIETIADRAKNFRPESFWETQTYYVEMIVEKDDLRRNVFDDALSMYPIPCTNGKGWSDINSRAEMMHRFQEHYEAGRKPLLLYCGDHDPKGLEISSKVRKNLADMNNTWFEDGREINFNADLIIIDRFGLSFDFIEENNLTWIDNLITSSKTVKFPLDDPRHPDHTKAYVQDYIAMYGVRKCEANALTVAAEAGHQLCVDAIHQYINDSAAADYYERMEIERQKVRDHIAELMQGAK